MLNQDFKPESYKAKKVLREFLNENNNTLKHNSYEITEGQNAK